MASKGAKAALIDTSIKRLQANIDRLSKEFGVDPLVIPTHDRDPEYLMGLQLDAMANWTEGVVKQFEATPIVDALDGDRDTEDAPKEQNAPETSDAEHASDIDTLKVSKRSTKGKSDAKP